MEQQIRFCTTSDGARIAYATAGQGPPLVSVAGWFSHLEFEWGRPLFAFRNLEPLGDSHLIVRFNGRGMGLSDRNVKDFALEGKVKDLEAVVDALGLGRLSLIGQSESGATAITYAVQHPERVDRLILYAAFAHWPRPLETDQQRKEIEAAVTLMRAGWGQDVPAYRQFFTSFFFPDADAETLQAFSEMERLSASPENAAEFLSSLPEIDVTDLLPQIKVPTLVIHRRGDNAVPFDAGRELASLIPAARFLPLEGRNHGVLPGEAEFDRYFDAIKEFLAEGRKPVKRKARTAAAAAGPLAIMFTDMEGSTTLTQRLGDAKAQELLRTHNAIIRDALKAHQGSEIKHTGDGVMASFSTASKALECAVAIQRAFAARNESETDTPIRVRIGLNAGEPVAEDQDLFGAAVQLAARVCARAEPGQILAANVVRELAMGKGFLFADLGEVVLRGFEDPVRLYEVRPG